MAQKSSNTKKILNLVASLLVTAALILVWHFVLPHVGEKTNLIKLISYSILLFNVLWIVDAVLSLRKLAEGMSNQEIVAKAQNLYALVGFVVFLVFSALVHAVVAVFFGDNQPVLLISGFSKCGLTLIGFGLLLQNSLHFNGNKLWTLISGIATFAAGLIFSTFLNLNATVGIMCTVAAIFFFIDVFLTGKKLEVSPIRFTIWEAVYVAVMALALLIIRFIPIHLSNHIATYSVRAVVNLAFAAVIDVIFIIISVIMRKNKKKKTNC